MGETRSECADSAVPVNMSDEKDSPGHPEEPTATGAEASVPMQMQLFSTWEVRKVPANCVSRFVQKKGRHSNTQKGG